MNRIILASHGGMSAGVRDTITMVLGDLCRITRRQSLSAG